MRIMLSCRFCLFLYLVTLYRLSQYIMMESSTTVWMDSSDSQLEKPYFYLNGSNDSSNKDIGRHSSICVEQGSSNNCSNSNLSYTIYKAKKVYCNQTSATTTQNNKDEDSTINIRCQSAGASDCGKHTGDAVTKLSTTDIKEYSVNTDKSQVQHTSKPPEYDHLAVAVPVALVAVAIVLGVCCIFCTVCGVMLYRKRERVLTIVRIWDKKKNNSDLKERGKCDMKSRFYVNNEIMHPQDEEELYSTASTANVYANNTSFLQANCSDEQKELFKETSFSKKHNGNCMSMPGYGGNVAKCSALNRHGPSSELYPSMDSSASNDIPSSRYISDGLLYITLKDLGKSSGVKPVKKAKSVDNVEYATLDFAKTNMLNVKKQRRKAAKKH